MIPAADAAVAAQRLRLWEQVGLLVILGVSAVLELWHLNQLGTPNTFYAAAVLSMTQNLHAFLFNSLDAAGFVTIDKPPLGFWVQVLSAKLLGFSGFSILLPEALATIASVGLLFQVVKRAFGPATGLLAALALALVPISVLVGRNNTIDALLVLTLLIAVWTGLKATERGSLGWLLVTVALVGLGFEIKMLEAYLVVPALGLVYLLGAPRSRRSRLAHLGLAAGVMLVVSLAWPVAVDLTPASLRPWIDSTQNNSAISLALGYNGIDRLLGQNRSLSQFLSGLGLTLASASDATSNGFGGGGMFNNGPAGVLRLLDEQLAGQASWLLPLSVVGIAMAASRAITDRLAFVHSRQGQVEIVFGIWLLAAGAFFSVANFFHSYYLVTLGPPIAALAASATWHLWQLFRAHRRLGWLLPLALVGTALGQAHILSFYPTWSRWLSPLVVAGAGAGSALLLVALLRGRRHGLVAQSSGLRRAGLGVALAALLLAPGVWSGYSMQFDSNGGIPAAGPQVAGSGGFASPGGAPPAMAQASASQTAVDGRAARVIGDQTDRSAASVADGGAMPSPGAGGGPGDSVSSALISYLEANQGSATYLVATSDSQTAASIILASDQPVMSLGGFTGSDPILSVNQFASLVASGQVRYVLVGGGPGGPQGGGTSAIMAWVEANATLVPATALGGNSQAQLYDLSTLQGATA